MVTRPTRKRRGADHEQATGGAPRGRHGGHGLRQVDPRQPAQAEPGRPADPRQERPVGPGRADLLAPAHRARCQEGAAIGYRQCREQPPARRRSPLRQGSDRRQGAGHEAVPYSRSWPVGEGAEVLQQSDGYRPRAGRGAGIMGQKINPIGLRLGINRTWDSRWFARKEYGNLLHEDLRLRKYLMTRLNQAGISRVVIERAAKKARVTIHTARPGVVIGKKGADIEKLRLEVGKMTGSEVSLNIVEIRKPELDAKLIAEGIAQQLERRVAFRRAMKRAVQSAMRLGAGGIRINCSGRLGGAEIARMEWYREGRVPLHTLRADVDYGVGTAKTTYGTCGVKVWVFKGEIMEHDPMAQDKRAAEGQQAPSATPSRGERGDRDRGDRGRDRDAAQR